VLEMSDLFLLDVALNSSSMKHVETNREENSKHDSNRNQNIKILELLSKLLRTAKLCEFRL